MLIIGQGVTSHKTPPDRYIQDKGTSSGTVKYANHYANKLDAKFTIMFFRPFVIDLESTNGTFVNDEKIPSARFYELKAGDGTSILVLGAPVTDIVRFSHQIWSFQPGICFIKRGSGFVTYPSFGYYNSGYFSTRLFRYLSR